MNFEYYAFKFECYAGFVLKKQKRLNHQHSHVRFIVLERESDDVFACFVSHIFLTRTFRTRSLSIREPFQKKESRSCIFLITIWAWFWRRQQNSQVRKDILFKRINLWYNMAPMITSIKACLYDSGSVNWIPRGILNFSRFTSWKDNAYWNPGKIKLSTTSQRLETDMHTMLYYLIINVWFIDCDIKTQSSFNSRDIICYKSRLWTGYITSYWYWH